MLKLYSIKINSTIRKSAIVVAGNEVEAKRIVEEDMDIDPMFFGEIKEIDLEFPGAVGFLY